MNEGGRGAILRVAGILAVAAYYAVGVIWHRSQLEQGVPSFDTYAYFVPSFLYVREAIAQGYGLLWNEFQNCGQPYFGNIQSALLYPINWLYLLGNIDHGLILIVTANLFIGGVGVDQLCRELQLKPLACFAGALAFSLGGAATTLASWNTTVLGTYVWLPVAMSVVERILRRPSDAAGPVLGIVLTLQLCAGIPQVLLFTYMAIALRVGLELLSGRLIGATALRCLTVGMILPALLGAVQLIPAYEVLRESVRGAGLSLDELRLWNMDPDRAWAQFLHKLGERRAVGNVLTVSGTIVIALGISIPRCYRRLLLCYGLMALVFAVFSFVGDAFLLLYDLVPIVRVFRDPTRFLWVVGFCTSVLVALGVHAVTEEGEAQRTASQRVRILAVCMLAFLGFVMLAGWNARWWEYAVAAALGAGVMWGGSQSTWKPAGVVAVLAINFLAVSSSPQLRNLKDSRVLYKYQAVFDAAKKRAENHSRIYHIGAHDNFGLGPRAASLFQVRSIFDYEHMTPRRFAELLVRMWINQPMRTYYDFTYHGFRWVPANRPLFNLMAARYLIVDLSVSQAQLRLYLPGLRTLYEGEDIRVYANLQALPRAFYVPRVVAMESEEKLLERLASKNHDPRRVALVEAQEAERIGRTNGSGRGKADIVFSRGERVKVRVTATEPGFLYLADQYYPGWRAKVNGRAAPIYRANYAFRLVPVPRGLSTVVFEYKPLSLRIGAVISGVTAVTLLVFCVYHLRKRRRGLIFEQ